MPRLKTAALLAAATALACSRADSPAPSSSTPTGRADSGDRALRAATVVTADSAMVVSASPYATNAGLAVLKSGGNAIDAAVAVAFTLAVTYPTAGNIGGGGFLAARVKDKSGTSQSVALDFREVAPAAASRDMYLDSTGAVTDKSLNGALAAGVPGSVAGLYEARRRYGSRRALARERQVRAAWHDVARAAARGGVASHRRACARWFFLGETAQLIASAMKQHGGIITAADLARYTPVWRTTVEFDYRGHHVVSMPPASSGGLTLALILGIVAQRDIASLGWRSAASIHLLAEAERRAFARRNALLGDPAFGSNPTEPFLSKDTAVALNAEIPDRASSASSAKGVAEPRHTTHFSVVDARGNAVSLTTTLNESSLRRSRLGVHGGGRAVFVERRDGRLHHQARCGERDGVGARRAQRDRAGEAYALADVVEHDAHARTRFNWCD